MFMKYKCSVELELQFPDADEKTTATAKAAIEELIDGAIYDCVFNEMCSPEDKLSVVRELLEYVDGDPEITEESDTACCACEENETQDVVPSEV